jgi:pilus assembly protein CpaF
MPSTSSCRSAGCPTAGAILSITEVTGLGDNIISTQELYRHEPVQNPAPRPTAGGRSGILPHSPKLARMRPANFALDDRFDL